MLNWKARLKNKSFWITAVPAICLFAQIIASACGAKINLTDNQEAVVGVVNAIFALLTCIGVINDPTVSNGALGIADSQLAMTYEAPKTDAQSSVGSDELIKKVINVARAEIGYFGHASADQLDDAQANPGGKYTKYARDLDNISYFYGKKQGYDWCCVFVCWIFVQAFGVDKARIILSQPVENNYSSVVKWVASYLGNEIDPKDIKPGDIAIYDDYDHVGIVTEVGDTTFKCLSGNALSGSPLPGGGVKEFTHYIGQEDLTHYVRPNWNAVV